MGQVIVIRPEGFYDKSLIQKECRIWGQNEFLGDIVEWET